MVDCGDDSDTERERAYKQYDKGTWCFPSGIASGDPRADSVVLWTRIESSNSQYMQQDIEILVEVSTVAFDDPLFTQTDLLLAHPIQVQAKYGHTVHHKLQGLVPEQYYWYRFIVGEEISVQGRTKTAPEASATTPLKFAY